LADHERITNTVLFLYVYDGGEFRLVNNSEIDATAASMLMLHYDQITVGIISRTDLDDPFDYGVYPPLGECPLSEEQIEALHPQGSIASIEKYLGTYNGYTAFEVCSGDNALGREIIGGYVFRTCDYEPFLYDAEGTKYSLQNAFNHGLINREDLRRIAHYCYGESGLRWLLGDSYWDGIYIPAHEPVE